MSLKAPHPLSMSIDHIIPLSRGGTHEPDNVQLAHFICNSIKCAQSHVFAIDMQEKTQTYYA